MDPFDELIRRVNDAGRHLAFYGPQIEEQIQQLETAFGVPLPPSYRNFLLRYGGGGEVGRSPIAGIYDGQPLLEGGGSLYGETMLARQEFQLPESLLVVFRDDDIGAIWALDVSNNVPGEESPVVSWDVPHGRIDRTIAPTFADFLRQYLELRTKRRTS